MKQVICLLISTIIILCCFSIGCNSPEIKQTIIATKDEATFDEKVPTPTEKETQPKATEIILPTEIETNSSVVEENDIIEESNNIEETYLIEEEKETYIEETYPFESNSSCIYTAYDFQMAGIIDWGGWTWTYYSQNILPGDGLYLPGRHVDENGYICDGDGYLCLASTALPWGTIVNTPFGKDGKVYDSGCASYILDVYVAW